nr:hypothetical protein [Candidatus Sigynarchaeota archaeon]
MAMARACDPAVFVINDPKCPLCDAGLDFTVHENYEGTGIDWITWYCKDGCGFYLSAPITS